LLAAESGAKNGSSNGSELAMLQATFADTDYVFRHSEDCRLSSMRWQCGRNVADIVTLAEPAAVAPWNDSNCSRGQRASKI